MCVICQTKNRNDDKELRSTEQGLHTLSNNLIEFWKIGKLDIQSSCLTNEFENDAPSFFKSFVLNKDVYHKDCHSRYNRQKLEREKAKFEEEKKISSMPSRRSISKTKVSKNIICSICTVTDDPNNTHAAGTYHAKKHKVDGTHNKELTGKMEEMANVTENEELLKLLSTGDLAANEKYYHGDCYKELMNKYNRINAGTSSKEFDIQWMKARAFSCVVDYILSEEDANPGSVFKVIELERNYIQQLDEYNIHEASHFTRFCERLLSNIDNLQSINIDGKLSVTFTKTIEGVVKDHVQSPYSFLSSVRKVVIPIRKQMFEINNTFTGQYNDNSQVDSVPKQLLLLMSMLINVIEPERQQDVLSCAQLVVFNSKKHESKSRPYVTKRHGKGRETHVAVYTALNIYYTVRSRNLIDHLFKLGICISYDRVLDITKGIYEQLREGYLKYQCFFPNVLKKGVFTILLKDNNRFKHQIRFY